MDIHKAERLYGLLVVTGAIFILLSVFLFDGLTLAYLGIILACIAIFVVQPMAKCPHCGKRIKLKFSLPSRCPHCGVSLKPESDEP